MKSMSHYDLSGPLQYSAQKNTYKKILLKCQNGLTGQYVCINNICSFQSAIMCNDQNCTCKILHDECFRAQLSSVLMTIQSKSIPLDKIRKDINEMFQNAIDKLSQIRDNFMSKYSLLFASKSYSKVQQQFLRSASSKCHDKITGKLISQIYFKINNREELNKIVLDSKQNLDQLLNPLLNNVDQFGKKIEAIILKLNENFGHQNKSDQQLLDEMKLKQPVLFKESKLIKNLQEETKILKSQKHKVKSVQLLFRQDKIIHFSQDINQLLNQKPILIFRTKKGELVFTSPKTPIYTIECLDSKQKELIQYPSFSKKVNKTQISPSNDNEVIISQKDFQLKPQQGKQITQNQKEKLKLISVDKNQLIYVFQSGKKQTFQIQNFQSWKMLL